MSCFFHVFAYKGRIVGHFMFSTVIDVFGHQPVFPRVETFWSRHMSSKLWQHFFITNNSIKFSTIFHRSTNINKIYPNNKTLNPPHHLTIECIIKVFSRFSKDMHTSPDLMFSKPIPVIPKISQPRRDTSHSLIYFTNQCFPKVF